MTTKRDDNTLMAPERIMADNMKGNTMKLKHGKKYETANGVVYKVQLHDNVYKCDGLQWYHDGTVTADNMSAPDLIRRHYTKPQPAHKLDLKPGDVVELVAWEDGHLGDIGETFECDDLAIPSPLPKGKRPLFKVVSRSKR